MGTELPSTRQKGVERNAVGSQQTKKSPPRLGTVRRESLCCKFFRYLATLVNVFQFIQILFDFKSVRAGTEFANDLRVLINLRNRELFYCS